MGTPGKGKDDSSDESDPKCTEHDALGSGFRGERISVCRKKGCVYLLTIGKPPFAMVSTKRGPAIVTSGYQANTFSDREYWLGETKVEPEGTENDTSLNLEKVTANKPLYRFTSVQDPSKQSAWQETPTEAYRQCYELRHPDKAGNGNGQLIIGITYPNLQEKILEAYPEATGLLTEMRNAYLPTLRRSQRKNYFSSTDAESSASPTGSESRSLDDDDVSETRKKSRSQNGGQSRPHSQANDGSDEDHSPPFSLGPNILPVLPQENAELPPISIDGLDASGVHLTNSMIWTWTLVSPSSHGDLLLEEEEEEDGEEST